MLLEHVKIRLKISNSILLKLKDISSSKVIFYLSSLLKRSQVCINVSENELLTSELYHFFSATITGYASVMQRVPASAKPTLRARSARHAALAPSA